MRVDHKAFDRSVSRALSGKGAHVEAKAVFAGLGWQAAGTRLDAVQHSVFQLLNHMIYWQDWVIEWLDGKKPPIPKHAAGSWPGGAGPSGSEEWARAVRRFQTGLEDLNRRARKADLFATHGKKKTRLEMLHTIASHNSYHAGQVVLLRRMLGAWPPPSGGLTW